MQHNLFLEYDNILIRQLEEKDLEYLRVWRNNPENSKYLRQIPYITREMQYQWYQSYLVNHNEIAFAIEETKDIGEFVGSASLYDFSDGKAEFGKILIGNEEAHGKKIGYKTTRAVLTIAFDVLNLNLVVLECHEKNISAIRVYERAGFVLERQTGTTRYYRITKEEFEIELKKGL